MKIQVKNLGILNEVEIDLKPLTIFVGPNNSGKTLLAYVLLAIFGQTGFDKYQSTLDKNKIAEVYPPLDRIIQQLINEGNAQIDLCQFADEHAVVYINAVAREAKKWLAEFMQVKRFSFENLEIKIGLEQKKEQMLQRIVSSEVNEGISSGQRKKESLVNVTKKQGDSLLYFYTTGSVENLPESALSAFVIKKVFEIIHHGLYVNTYAFPTERTTAIPAISSFFSQTLPDMIRKSSFRVASREAAEGQAADLGSGSFQNFVSLMQYSIFKGANEQNDDVQKHPSVYRNLSQILQKEILGGNLSIVSRDDLGISRELVFAASPDVELEMNMVSSMVKELAPLALYLSYSAQAGEWLIIDEPELNLHPEAQVKLTELLTTLVNADLSLLFTTHSPYIVDHLVNLMEAYKHEDKELIKEMFYLQQTESFISKDDIAAYLFEGGTAKSILGEDEILHWGTFGDVSDRVTQIYFDL
jgi:ABC-type multidrug transport system ATPase subunit